MADINQDGKVDIHDYEKPFELSLLKSGIYAKKWIIIFFYIYVYILNIWKKHK